MVRNPKNKKIYNTARKLRKKGLSYRKIANHCNISKSNVSLWCRDIKLSPKQYSNLNLNKLKILKLGSKRLHEKRLLEIENVKKLARKEMKNKEISESSFLIAGAMIYWGEGCKTVGLSVTNSDEKIIIFMIKWFEKFLNIDISKQIKAHLHIHSGNNDLKIKKHWSTITGIPLENFGKSSIKPKGTGHRKKILEYGIIRIRVQGKGMENLRHRIMTWIDEIYNKTIINNQPR